VDLLISDVAMPEMDGYELIRRVRQRGPERNGDVPAVALTAYARSEDRTRAMLAGFTGHISKPVEPAELVASVAALTRRAAGRS
jgi:CheY-like chemotaxis protein